MTALDALRARLSTAECAAALVFNPVNIRYLTGYHSNAYSRPLTLIVPVHGDPVFLVPRLEAQQARTLTGVQDVRDYVEWADGARAGGGPEAEWGALLADALRSTQGQIAVEEGALTAGRAELVHKVAAHARAVDATGWIDAMRVIKSSREVDNHRRAAALAGAGLDAARQAVERAESEREIYAAAFGAMLTEAARTYPDEPVAVSGNAIVGPRTASLHLPATGVRPVAGDLVFVVLVASIGGSWCELSRTMIAGGDASAEQTRVFRAVARACDAARACLRPGVAASDVDQAARNALAVDELAAYQPMRTGHGLGMSGGSEAPQLGAADQTPLKSGMVVSIEPSVCIPGFGGVCWADNFVITESGADQLSDYPVVVP